MTEEVNRPGFHRIVRRNEQGKVVSEDWVQNDSSQNANNIPQWRPEEKSRKETGGRQSQSPTWRENIGAGLRRHPKKTSLFKDKK